MPESTRKHDLEIEIAATPEQVWEALSTGQGVQSWFAPIAEVEPGPGGKRFIKWCEGMEGSQRNEIWEPNRHLRTVSDRGEDAPPTVVDYLIESRGGITVLRMVHSGFGEGASFDSEFESTGSAWPVFLHMLKHSVEMGTASARNVSEFRMPGVTQAAAWAALMGPEGMAAHGAFDQAVVRLFNPGRGFCLEFPERHGAMLSLFCETCGGSSMITITWLLYGRPAAEAEALHHHCAELLDRLFGETTAA